MSSDRITDLNCTVTDIIADLSEGNPGVMRVLVEILQDEKPGGIFRLLNFDTKRLYGSRIWELFSDVCGKDIQRFKYHVDVELPNQETGELSVSGPWAPSLGNEEWWQRRQFGEPGSFWALEEPPTDPYYEYPIG